MTVISALVEDGIIHMAGDRALSDDNSIVSMMEPKITIKDQYILGNAGNAGFGQKLIHTLTLPVIKPGIDINYHIHSILIPWLQLKADGIDEGELLIGLRSHLYIINMSDWQGIEIISGAIGSGYQYAMGSLYSTKGTPKSRVVKAIESAITYSPSCQGPIDYIALR